MYTIGVPKLWSETIETHRRAVRDATLETTVALVAAQGLRAVTMSRIAEETGIGRATLYKYFPDVESILVAWHDEQVASHIAQLGAIAERDAEPIERLTAVLEGYAVIQHDLRTAHGTELVALLHHRKHVVTTRQHLNHLVEKLLAEGAAAGQVRGDVAPAEMANYCLHALSAASGLPSRSAVQRLVGITISGLLPPRQP